MHFKYLEVLPTQLKETCKESSTQWPRIGLLVGCGEGGGGTQSGEASPRIEPHTQMGLLFLRTMLTPNRPREDMHQHLGNGFDPPIVADRHNRATAMAARYRSTELDLGWYRAHFKRETLFMHKIATS